MNEAVPEKAPWQRFSEWMRSPEKVTDQVTENGHLVQLANLNCPGQIVISGTAKGVELASEEAKTTEQNGQSH